MALWIGLRLLVLGLALLALVLERGSRGNANEVESKQSRKWYEEPAVVRCRCRLPASSIVSAGGWL